jgi:hypothetical protein
MLCLVVLIVQRHLEKNKLIILFQEEKEEKSKIFDKILDIKGESLSSLAYDYTYWDEMVSFLKVKTKPGLTTIWQLFLQHIMQIMYGFTRQVSHPVYSVSNLEKTGLKTIPIDERSMTYLFRQKKSLRSLFCNTPEGLLEIRGCFSFTQQIKKELPNLQVIFLQDFYGTKNI